MIAGYWSVSVYLVVFKGKNHRNKDFTKQWFIWIKIFLAFQSLTFLPPLFLNWAIDPITGYYLAHFSSVVLNLDTGLALFFYPRILYGLDQEKFEHHQIKKKLKGEIFEQLTQQKIEEIKLSLQNVLEVDKKYLIHGYSINDLSKDTSIPSYLLSLYINNVLNSNFPDLINKERIEECCKMMASGKYSHLATEGFAQICGFNNRNSFSTAFKKHKGVSPPVYYKEVSKGLG